MNRTFITDITHFLDEKGAIPPDLPKPAINLAENLGKIISHATTQVTQSTNIKVSDQLTASCLS
jgi:hypothetical protein